jgi:hypothetical protein
MKPHPEQDALFEHIERAINGPPPTIEEALDEALANGRIDQKEHDECLGAYERAFFKTHELYPDEPS